jgi:hypothetical protein
VSWTVCNAWFQICFHERTGDPRPRGWASRAMRFDREGGGAGRCNMFQPADFARDSHDGGHRYGSQQPLRCKSRWHMGQCNVSCTRAARIKVFHAQSTSTGVSGIHDSFMWMSMSARTCGCCAESRNSYHNTCSARRPHNTTCNEGMLTSMTKHV